jgi:peptidoglycan/xylan/chitin deacetylase (PgdA/CDA1 family)
VLESWLEEWEAMYEFGGLFMLTVHPWVSGKGQRIRMLRKLLEQIMQKENVWIATAQEIAEYHINSVNKFEVRLEPLSTNF